MKGTREHLIQAIDELTRSKGQATATGNDIYDQMIANGVTCINAGWMYTNLWEMAESGKLRRYMVEGGPERGFRAKALYALPLVKCRDCKLFQTIAERYKHNQPYDSPEEESKALNEGLCLWPSPEYHQRGEPGPHWFHRSCDKHDWNAIGYPDDEITCRGFQPRQT